jgi:hypothetical protein
VRAIVIYESLTGNTKTAGEAIAQRLRASGVAATAFPITNIDYQELSAADLVVIGSWVDGIFVVGQRPGRVGRIAKMPSIAGKRAVVYLTYALNPGKALQKLSDTVSGLGAEVLGGVTIRRDHIVEGVDDFVDRILDTTASTS